MMKAYLAALFLLTGFTLPSSMVKNLPHSDKRYYSFLLALQLIDERDAKVIVETGTARAGDEQWQGDGASTIIFGQYAAEHDLDFWSVDISPESIAGAKRGCDKYGCKVNFVEGDSISFLKEFPEEIDFLYLDSYDYDFGNPYPSQEHHLKEIKAAYPHLHEGSVVMIDDCRLRGGGKGRLAIAFLRKRGWRVAYSGYQVILTRGAK